MRKRASLLRRLSVAWDVVRGAPAVGGKRGDFRGASTGRAYADVVAALRSVDLETRGDLGLLRARARKLVRDNSYAAGFVGELVSNVVGPQGIAFQARTRDANGAFRREINRRLEQGWTQWGMPESASLNGRLSWEDQQRLLVAQLATDGELLFRKVRFADNPFGFTLQMLDPDFLDHTYFVAEGTSGLPRGVSVRMGVECDRSGRALAYHLWDRHPSEVQRTRERIPASEIVHDFIPYRVGQVRGVTWFAPVLSDILVYDSFNQAELKTARTAAATMGFILNKSPEAIEAYQAELARKIANGEAEPDPLTFEVEPAVMHELAPGQEIAQFNPAHPSPEFTAFSKVILRGIARGLGMAYTTLTGDLEAVNYSSIRAGLLGERDIYRMLQRWTTVHVCRPVFRAWLEMALTTPEALGLPTRKADDYADVAWMPRGWKWVDPLKDLQAAQLAISLGLACRTDIAAEQGHDYETTIANLAAEEELAAEYGVTIDGAPAAGAPGAAGTQPGAQPGQPDAREAEEDDPEADARASTPISRRRLLSLPIFRRSA